MNTQRPKKSGKWFIVHDLSKSPRYFDQVLLLSSVDLGPTIETFTKPILERPGSKLFFVVTYDGRISMDCKNFHFYKNALITAIVIGVVAGAQWDVYHPTLGCLMGCYLSHCCPAWPLSFVTNWFLYWSDHLWFDGFRHHYLHQGNSLSSRVTPPLVLPFILLSLRCHLD